MCSWLLVLDRCFLSRRGDNIGDNIGDKKYNFNIHVKCSFMEIEDIVKINLDKEIFAQMSSLESAINSCEGLEKHLGSVPK